MEWQRHLGSSYTPIRSLISSIAGTNEPLNKSHGAILSEHEIAPQGIHDHEYDLVERRMRFRADPLHSIVTILPICETGQYRLIGKEASCE